MKKLRHQTRCFVISGITIISCFFLFMFSINTFFPWNLKEGFYRSSWNYKDLHFIHGNFSNFVLKQTETKDNVNSTVIKRPFHNGRVKGVNVNSPSEQEILRGQNLNQVPAGHDKPIQTGIILWYMPPNFQHIIDSEKTMDFSKCGFPNNCTHIINPEFINRSDAVIFHGTSLPNVLPKRRQQQFWIFYTLESPQHIHPMRTEWRRQFDWMMNYRRDSEIFLPYGNIYKRQTVNNVNFTEIMHKKKQPIAWIVSNCHAPSGRTSYVNELKKHVNVELFGRCGKPIQSSYANSSRPAYKTVSSEFKFYLSFENSVCTDYATEKLFNVYFSDIHMIPIVRGKFPYDEVLPKGTYLNTADFKSPEELAERIKYLDNNDDEYVKMLKEKVKYNALDIMSIYYQSLCNICEKIQNPQVKVQVDKKDTSTWIHNGTCGTLNDVT